MFHIYDRKKQSLDIQKINFHFSLWTHIYLDHISEKEFKLINWLPTNKKADQRIDIITYNFINDTCPYYPNEIFEFTPRCRIDKKNNFVELKNPFRKSNMGRKTIAYSGVSIWNSLPDSIKKANTFKYNIKKHYLN